MPEYPLIEMALKDVAAFAGLILEGVAVVVVIWGAALGVIEAIRHAGEPSGKHWRRDAWVSLGMWLMLALQFALGADIVRSVIAPSWNDIAQLAAIAVIRTFLNYFLEKDIEETRRSERTA